jgi:aerobic-type carbon monoxide dehydrogenase small subunit (CoxS/CutS family)
VKIEVTINGKSHNFETGGHRRLLDVLREELALVGTKEGCGEGECGACTVILEGQVVNSCLVAAGQVHGKSLTTIEGMAESKTLHVVQEALIRYGGAQCGICTPGVALCAKWALDMEPKANKDRLRELMSGNICRCTGYQAIVDAVVDVQGQMGAGDE